MNLGQAVAVLPYETRAQQTKSSESGKKQLLAASGETERITCTLLDALCLSGYLKGPRTTEPKRKFAV